MKRFYIVERHLKPNYPCLFKDLPDTEIIVKEPVGVCTDIFYIITTKEVAEKYKVTKMTKEYLSKGIGSFEFSDKTIDI